MKQSRFTDEQIIGFLKQARKLPQIENNMKIEASISLRRRDEEVKVHFQVIYLKTDQTQLHLLSF